MMCSVFVGTSLDGFIARPNGDFDFLPEGGGEPHGYNEFMATIDAIVLGRNTFEKVLTLGPWPYGKKRVVVLSHRPIDLSAAAGGVVEHMTGTPAEIVSRLAESGAQHLYIDGGITIQEFLRAGLIQRLTITRVPVLIGNGADQAVCERTGQQRVSRGCRLASRPPGYGFPVDGIQSGTAIPFLCADGWKL
jgi:dihydrofolate reductase